MLKKIGFAILVLFALIGLLFTAVFIAMQFGWLNVRGSSASTDQYFESAPRVLAATSTQTAVQTTQDPEVSCVSIGSKDNIIGTCPWNSLIQWTIIRDGLAKDASVIDRVAAQTQVPSRNIVAVVVPEQLRFFTSDRQSFKNLFEPLKVLGAMTQFSLGVSGIKVDTAHEIESYACTASSAFYPGPGYCSMLSYPGAPSSQKLYNRLTDQSNHYYSYLYTAIYLKEIQAQWQNAGIDISDQPGIDATLFNIGFKYSHPNAYPKMGGAVISLNKVAYNYGELAERFFVSNELTDQFPAN